MCATMTWTTDTSTRCLYTYENRAINKQHPDAVMRLADLVHTNHHIFLYDAPVVSAVSGNAPAIGGASITVHTVSLHCAWSP